MLQSVIKHFLSDSDIFHLSRALRLQNNCNQVYNKLVSFIQELLTGINILQPQQSWLSDFFSLQIARLTIGIRHTDN